MVLRYEYELSATIVEVLERVELLRFQAGCFVLLSDFVDQQDNWPAVELLALHKSQIGIEKTFNFLIYADPFEATHHMPAVTSNILKLLMLHKIDIPICRSNKYERTKTTKE